MNDNENQTNIAKTAFVKVAGLILMAAGGLAGIGTFKAAKRMDAAGEAVTGVALVEQSCGDLSEGVTEIVGVICLASTVKKSSKKTGLAVGP